MKIVAFFLCVAVTLFAQQPVALWTSHPVDPGDAVMVYGGPFTSNSVVKLGKTVLAPLAITPETVTFIYPQGRPLEAFSVQIDGTDVAINMPSVWWLQGDQGRRASPGGWLRVFGRSIAFTQRASLRVGDCVCTLEKADRFDLKARIPASLAPGEYPVILNNGFCSQPVGHITIGAEKKSDLPLFDITHFGAVPNDLRDDTHAIQAALASIKTNNGGILYVPRGRFGMRGTLVLPPNTVLKGADCSLSQMYWADEDDPTGALISGTHDFRIEHIFLAAGNFERGIVTEEPQKNDMWKNENVTLHRVRTRFLHTDSGGEEGLRRMQQRPEAWQLRITAERLTITACDFYASKGSSSIQGTYATIEGNRFGGPDCTYYGGRCLIMENNDHTGQAMSFGNGTREAVVRNNRFGRCFGDGDRETFTFDGGCPCYYGPAEKIGKTTLTFPSFGWNRGQAFWLGKPVYIVAGKGRGQYRDIARMLSATEIELAAPWAIEPDATSRFAIAHNRYNILLLDNVIEDGNPFQLYGSAVDVVVAGNQASRNSGIQSHAMGEKTGPKPNWFIQFIGNQILEGNSVRGPQSYQVPARDAWLGFFDQGMPGPDSQPQNLVGIMRNNTLHNNAFIGAHGRVRYLLVDNNTIHNADKGVEIIAADVKDSLVRRTTVENVLNPVNIHSGIEMPAEDYLALLVQILEKQYPQFLPENWKKIKVLSPVEAGLAIIPAVAQKAAGKSIPRELFAVLTGINLEQRNPWPLSRIASGRVTAWDFYTDYRYSPICPSAVLSTGGTAPAGWTIEPRSSLRLTPGQRFEFPVRTLRSAPATPVTLALPVSFTLAGDGWTLATTSTYRCDTLDVDDFLVAGPFPLPASLRALDAADLLTQTITTWKPLVNRQEYRVPDLDAAFSGVTNATFLVKAVIRAKKPMTVRIGFPASAKTAAFFNGVRMGSSTRRDALRTVDLAAGENTLMLIVIHEKGEHRLPVTVYTDGTEDPGDMTIVPVVP